MSSAACRRSGAARLPPSSSARPASRWHSCSRARANPWPSSAAEKANPKLDVWFGGTGDPHLQAAEQDLTLQYKSPMLDQLHPWAKKTGRAIRLSHRGPLSGLCSGLGYNTELLAKKKAPCPGVLARSRQARLRRRCADGQSQRVRHGPIPRSRRWSSSSARRTHSSCSRTCTGTSAPMPARGVGPIKATARGENIVAVAFIHDVITEAQAGFPVKSVAPCERHRLRDRLDIHRQGGAQPRRREKVRRLGPDPPRRRSSVRNRSSFSCRRTSTLPCPPLSPKPSDIKLIDYNLRQVRCFRRAQAPARALGPRSRGRRAMKSRRRAWSGPPPLPSSRPSSLPASPRRRGLPRHRLRTRWPSIAARPIAHGARRWRTASRRPRASSRQWCRRRRASFSRRSRPRGANPKGDVWWAGPWRRLPAGRRGRPARDLQVAQSASAAGLGSARSPAVEVPVVGVYGGILALGYNTEIFAKKNLPVPKCWKDPYEPRIQGRGDAVQSELVGHGLSHACVAGADLRRGRGVQVYDGAQRQRQPVRARPGSGR